MHEYVSKKEYAPYKSEIEDIILRVQRIMKTKYNTTFQYELIGSGAKHLVTRIKNGNRGYDFDYNLILQKSDLWENPKKLKQQFMNAFSKAIENTPYNPPKDSTSVITIKVIDKKNSRIIRSCDLAIIFYNDADKDKGYMYLKKGKNNNYTFEPRNLSQNTDYKLQEILDNYDQGWKMIRDEYLKIKNNNRDENKKSHILYLESIHNVYNHLTQCEEIQNNEVVINSMHPINRTQTPKNANAYTYVRAISALRQP